MNFDQHVSVSLTKSFALSPERVFDAWLTPEIVKQWMFPQGNMVKAEIEPSVGGTFTFVDERGGELLEHTGTYLEIDRPGRLVFTWATVDDLPDTDRVIIEIVKTDSGCELTLTHQIHPNWKDYTKPTKEAWRTMLTAMEQKLQ